MPNPSLRGPWETAATPADNAAPGDDTRAPLLHAVIRPNRSAGRKPAIVFVLVAVVAAGLSLPFVLQGEWIVAVIFGVELSALGLATRAYSRHAAQGCEELRLFSDRLEIRTQTGGQVTIKHLPTALVTIEPPHPPASSAPGLVLCVAQRRLPIGVWLGAAQTENLRQTLETALALARRGGPATAPPHQNLVQPGRPSLAGGSRPLGQRSRLILTTAPFHPDKRQIMPLTVRLALIAAAILAASAIAFAAPLPTGLQHSHETHPRLATKSTPTAVCGCGAADRPSQLA